MNKLNQNEKIMYASKWMIVLSVIGFFIEVSLGVYLIVSGRIVLPDQVDINAYLGTFVSICTTFIVGFQIWNYISASEKLKEFEKEKNILTQEIQELKEVNSSVFTLTHIQLVG